MSRILLIEPDRMLRHALTLALVPDHQVAPAQALPEAMPLDVDLLIVDAAALQRRELFSPRQREDLASWHLPVLWFGADGTLPENGRDDWRRVTLPLTQETIRGAVVQCLTPRMEAAKVVVEKAVPLAIEAAAAPKAIARKKKSADTSERKTVIELVDIVDEESA
ncbi:MAG: hypothetical protein EXR70_18955 [Deltaproteobacteria bacterium]|nr:hypothetical protein [Deltaproteobacteria bacterium]